MPHPFSIVDAKSVGAVLEENPHLPIDAVEKAYLSHHRGLSINPPSAFLRLPESDNRVIALQAATQDPPAVGAKLIASWPGNINSGKPRASAVIVLNNADTGVPTALLEGSLISSARTAASAVLGARWLGNPKDPPKSMSIIGAGVIAAKVIETFIADNWQFESIGCFDINIENTRDLARRIETRCNAKIETLDTLDAALNADIVVCATTVSTPYLHPPHAFRPGQLVLNISLRDIAPELLLAAENVLDDVDHCLKQQTSPHLAEDLIGDRRFVSGTLAEVMTGEIVINHKKPIVFTPFGMGILDLTLAHAVLQHAQAQGCAIHLDNFIGGHDRWA